MSMYVIYIVIYRISVVKRYTHNGEFVLKFHTEEYLNAQIQQRDSSQFLRFAFGSLVRKFRVS